MVPVWSQIGFIQIPIWLPPVPIQLAIRVPIQVRIAVLIQIPFQFPIQAPVLIPIQRFHSSSHVQQLLGCFAGMIRAQGWKRSLAFILQSSTVRTHLCSGLWNKNAEIMFV